MKKPLYLSLLLLAPLSLQANNLDGKPDTLTRSFNLEQVVVTGTRTPRLLKQSPVLTRVISHADIRRTDATDIRDLLTQEMPGVEFTYSVNQMMHLNLSGFGGQSVLFLVDGERIAGDVMDDLDFSRLTLENVDHVEMVKGAASALYGSNAVGGVVNLITRRDTDPFSLSLNTRWGRHGEQRHGGSLSLGGKRWGNNLSVTYNTLDNYNVSSAADPVTRVVSTIYGDRVWNFNDRATWQPFSTLRLSARAGYYFREVKRSVDTPERYRDYNAGASLLWTPTKADQLSLSYSFDQYDKSDYQAIARLDIRDYSNVQNSLRLLYNHTFNPRHQLTFGGDYLHDYLMNTHLDGLNRRENSFDFFAQYDTKPWQRWEIVAALRYDHFCSGQLSRLTPKLNLRYEPLQGLVLRAGYGMGFRAPALKEKYYNFDAAGLWIITGNPDLKAETSHNYNVSAEYSLSNYYFVLNTYHNEVRNKIAPGIPYYASADATIPNLPYVNLDHYGVNGVEFTVRGRWDCGAYARLSYSYTDERLPKTKEGETANNQYVPARKHSGNILLGWQHEFVRGKRYLDVSLQGRVYSDVDNQEFKDYYDISKGTVKVHYPAYTLWRLNAQLRVCSYARITASADNLFNYKPKYHYVNAPLTDGINVRVGLKLDF